MQFGQPELDPAQVETNNFQQFVAAQAKAAKNVHAESQRKEQMFTLFNKGEEALNQPQQVKKSEFKIPFVPNSLSAMKTQCNREAE